MPPRPAPAWLCGSDVHGRPTDFWDLPKSLAGEFSESDLWVATGHGPDVVADLPRPFVDPRACVVYGHRDRAEQIQDGSEDVYLQPMLVRSLAELRAAGMKDAGHHAAAFLAGAGIDRVWLHVDADCLDDALMPAVDWRAAGGMRPSELVDIRVFCLRAGSSQGWTSRFTTPASTPATLTLVTCCSRSSGRSSADITGASYAADGRPIVWLARL
jgi:arginase